MLTLDHISKTFNPGTINEKRALDGLSLHLKPGDFVTVIGGNGAGKSTMLNAVAGFLLLIACCFLSTISAQSTRKIRAARSTSAACSRTP